MDLTWLLLSSQGPWEFIFGKPSVHLPLVFPLENYPFPALNPGSLGRGGPGLRWPIRNIRFPFR